MKKIFSGLIIVLVLLIAAVLVYMNDWLEQPVQFGGGLTYSVQRGSSLGYFAYEMQRKNIISYPRAFLLYARLIQETDIAAGEYFFPDGITLKKMHAMLVQGDVVAYQVTIVEGWTYKQAVDELHDQPKLVKLLKDPFDIEQLKQFGITVDHPEGWFFPDTYQYSSGTTDVDILQQAYQRMQTILGQEWLERDKTVPYEGPYQALIMASIVERETGVISERNKIAGVFVRRLNKKMRLQTDPTVIYGLGDRYRGNIKRRHLKMKTPYNTYVIKGLPPTPIALPGKGAIHAALHPDAGNELYFVAKGDGSHHFSSTLEEHNKAVQQYQIYRRTKDYRSSPHSQ